MSIGNVSGSIIGARVAGKDGEPCMTFVPAHNKNGQPINQRITIPVYVNKKKKRNGSEGRVNKYRVVAWGGLADTAAKCLSNGKEFHGPFELNSYDGRLYDANGNMRLNPDGSEIIIPRISLTLLDIIYGNDSLKRIDQEIAEGKRPVNWNNPTHPDAALWKQILANRQAVQYTPGMAMYGYARVVVATGPGITPYVPQTQTPAQTTNIPDTATQVANTFTGSAQILDAFGNPVQAQGNITPQPPVQPAQTAQAPSGQMAF